MVLGCARERAPLLVVEQFGMVWYIMVYGMAVQ